MRTHPLSLLATRLLAALACGGCEDAATSSPADMAVAASGDLSGKAPPDLLPQPPDLGCYPMATAYEQLLNACTTAQSKDKVPVTPLLNPDGTLPPLP